MVWSGPIGLEQRSRERYSRRSRHSSGSSDPCLRLEGHSNICDGHSPAAAMMSKKVKAKKKGQAKQAQAQQASELLDGADVEAGLGGMVSPRPHFQYTC